MFSKFRVSKRCSTMEDAETPGLVLVSSSRISENDSKRTCRHRVGRPIHDQKCAGCVKDRQSCVFPNSSTRCLRCIQRDRECHPRAKDGQDETQDTTSLALSMKQDGPSRALPDMNSSLGAPVSAESNSTRLSDGLCLNDTFGPSCDYVLSELTRQLPSLTREDAMPLSQMITHQLRRWTWPSPQLTFRRTKIIEKISRASVTIIDFECYSIAPFLNGTTSETRTSHQFTSTLVMSNISDPDNPELQLGCLWAPAFDGNEGATFAKETDHIISVFKHCSGGVNGYRDRFVNAVAIMSISPLYSKHFTKWDSNLVCPDAAIQRACAWGVVAAKSREIEYRLFAASLTCFLNFELHNNLAFHNQNFDVSLVERKNDISCILVPVIRIADVEIGDPSAGKGAHSSCRSRIERTGSEGIGFYNLGCSGRHNSPSRGKNDSLENWTERSLVSQRSI